MEEKELIKKSASGDCEAFEKLIEPYMQGIINHVYVMIRNSEDACDIAQEAFVKAFVGIDKFSGQSSFKTWLYKIATNVCLDEIRRRKRHTNITSLAVMAENNEQTLIDIADTSVGPEEVYEQSELRKTILKAIGELDEKQRTVIVLRELEGMDYNDISKTLGISLGTVKSRINRARITLREKLSKYRELL